MPNLVGIGNSQVPTNAMLGGLAYQDSVGNIDVEKIKARTEDTAVDVFVYDTRKDSDGGAWRHRTQGTSWYNEGASSIRGSRKEFPTVAILVAEATQITIYDGDDPNCPMWMVFNRGTDADTTSIWDGNNANNCTGISAKNGLMMWSTHTAGSYGADFIGERWIYFYIAANKCGYRHNGKGISDRNNLVSSRTTLLERFSGYANSHAHQDIAMTVVSNAMVDNVTGLPSPTVAIATDEGVNILQSNKIVTGYRGNHGGDYNQVMYVDFDTETNALLYTTDYGNGGSGTGQYKLNVAPPEIYTDYYVTSGAFVNDSNSYTSFQFHQRRVQTGGNITYPKIQGDYIEGLISAGYAKYGIMSRDNPTTSYPTVYNLMREYDGVDTLQNPSFPSLSQIAYIGSDYNSGWLFSDIRGAFLADTDTTDATATNLLSNGTFDSNTTGWTANNATLSVVSNTMKIHTDSQGYAYASATTVAGKQYVLSLNLTVDGNASLWIQIGSSTHGSGSGGNDLANLNPLGEGTRWGASVVAKSTTTYITLRVSTPGSNKMIFVDDVVFEEAERDHANSEYSNKGGGGLRVIGTVPKQVVNPGCDLVSYGPFNNSNYLQCPNNRGSYGTANKFDDFGTNSMWGMCWVNMTSHSNVNVICSGFTRSSGSNSGDQRWAWYINGSSGAGNLGFYQQNGNSNNNQTGGITIPLNGWNHIAFARLSQNSGELHFFVNGVHTYNNSGVTALDLSNANMTINVGTDRADSYPSDNATGGPFDEGVMSLLRIGRGELTVDIAKQIYDDEKELFVENAKCTLYGSSDLVTAQAYDSTRDILHLGTSAGRSDFVGLRRINNTTTAVTTAISASDGLIVEQ